MAEPTRKLAVLIDADNTQPGIAEALLAEIAKYGVASVKRIYGDWTLPNLKGWKEMLAEHAIQPVQQFRYTTGKNATDGRMIIDAMDLLYTERFDGFCLVSSDSDFTGLASRLRESGMTVFGFGERKTPGSLVSACDKFVYLDVLRESASDEAEARPKPKPAATLKQDAKLVRLLREAVDAASDDEGWAGLGAVGSLISKQAPDFDSRNYGFKKLSELVVATALFEIDERKSADGKQKTLYLRDKRRKN
ncbi:NYN domain-containing protein [Sinimarinibacterium flocculans]|uniref:OST-HTH/LOTUS domain-containing protein n=1 Tax=Sinimarinibacterium flocculans TaxID=985250 RepID=A0A318EAN6_9GAMM|nr:NYN domain-containing protein [Sinimarinibacterium flocculans]MEC9363304.1 NYN domain-containing protein [Pseudomonadota bacterium]PXV69541.1 OST-HTH/LOTUS domain-containing protein [Sinimarinibacterium flocculans]